jgi:hypothetical protein
MIVRSVGVIFEQNMDVTKYLQHQDRIDIVAAQAKIEKVEVSLKQLVILAILEPPILSLTRRLTYPVPVLEGCPPDGGAYAGGGA